jgi:nicotinamide-nucleotide amidase
MVRGARAHAPVDLAVSVTGIAGPESDDTHKPVGLVYFAAASRSGQFEHVEKKFGNPGRSEIRKRSVLQAFVMLHDLAEKEPSRA